MKTILIENKRHTIKHNGITRNFIYNAYTIYEYCDIVEDKEEVKHPSYKINILKSYGIK